MDDKKKSLVKSSSDIFNFTSEVRRLERNIGDFTRKLEHERRASILLDKEIEEMTHALTEKKTGYTAVKSLQKKVNKDHISEIEEQLELTMRQLSNIRASNQRLRDKIDSLRKDKTLCSQGNLRVEQDIATTRKQIIKINTEAIDFQKSLDQQQVKIMSIHKSQEQNNGHFSSRMSNLQSQILLDRKEGSKFLKDFTVKFAKPIADASELFQLTKNSAKNWKERCYSTLQEINKYQEFVKELNNGLQIMQKHSGKSNYQEIVTEYISSFEENIRLSNHVYELGEEIIHVTDEIAYNEEQISSLNSTKEYDYTYKEEVLQEKSNILLNLQTKNAEIVANTKETKEKLKSLIAPLTDMHSAFKEINLPLKLSQDKFRIEVPDGGELDIDNMKSLLKKLEEYIDQMVLMKSSMGNEVSGFTIEIPNAKGKSKFDVGEVESLIENDEHYPMSEHEMRTKASEMISKLGNN